MYTSFYNLKAKPFQISSDPDFMWLGEKHKEALATLKYGVLDNKGFLLLTGDVGTGKTTLINSLIQSLSDDIICTSVTDPSLSKLEFFNYIASSFGIDQDFLSKGAFLVQFRKFLLHAYDSHKKVLLIIDEAQLLTQELLEEIRLLSNIEKTNTKLINIFFVGQNEFNEILNQNQNRAVRQRLTLNYNIDPLTPDETDEYIKYRLAVAGAAQSIFEPAAVQEVFMYSGGFPRRINIICDHALLSGYVKDRTTINAAIVKECAKELKIPAYVRNRDIDGFSNYRQKTAPKVQSQPVVPRPRPPEEKKRKGIGNILTGTAGFFLFLVVCWWMLFPVSFQQFLSRADDQFNMLKNTTSNLLPKSLNSSQSPDNSNFIENKDNLVEKPVVQPEVLKPEVLKPEELKPDEPIIQRKIDNQDIKPPLLKEEMHLNSRELLQTDEKKPEQKLMALPKEKIIVRFKYNTNDFTKEGFKNLKSFEGIFTNYPDIKFLVAGYTDSNGYQKYNIKLSEFRANIVRSYLLGMGAKPSQIEVKGLGSINPIESNDTSWGRMMNRRVEVELVQ